MPARTGVTGLGDEDDVGWLEGAWDGRDGGDAGAEDKEADGEGCELGSVVGIGLGPGLGLSRCSPFGENACLDLKLELTADFSECGTRIAEGSV